MSTKIKEIGDNSARLSRGELDKLFIEYYLETVSAKQAYIRACKAGGHEFKEKYAAQYGKAMFDRLRKQISDEIDRCEVADAALARATRREIAKKGQSESARLTAATGLERKRADKLEINESALNIPDIDNRISDLQKRIKDKENK